MGLKREVVLWVARRERGGHVVVNIDWVGQVILLWGQKGRRATIDIHLNRGEIVLTAQHAGMAKQIEIIFRPLHRVTN